MYGKIYESTFNGSMVGSGPAVFAVWSYVIANTKQDSLVELNPDILATIIGTDLGTILSTIEKLCEEDVHSRSKAFEGRRLVKRGPYIYFVPNASKYRGLENDAARKQYFREKQREHRQRVKSLSNRNVKNVKQAVLSTHKAKAEEERVPSLSQVIEYGKTQGISLQDAEGYFDSQQSGGWKRNGRPLVDWKASLRNWKRYGYLPSQKKQSGGFQKKGGGTPPSRQSEAERWYEKTYGSTD